ncbi:hypothetical protein BO71DRAFT_411659 [Aspergillus ellipticus CBS 707.79]|uniref:Uncharacterized protein n=1 Tax=Aspergillus ellipticus CBS 707.79 TaxID=1448320 RepID=A0A319DU19_9EURO|nr:hypothetical protein BO71DRAFT_411659 [Aspergillus ellipticus CBS 707.79]
MEFIRALFNNYFVSSIFWASSAPSSSATGPTVITPKDPATLPSAARLFPEPPHGTPLSSPLPNPRPYDNVKHVLGLRGVKRGLGWHPVCPRCGNRHGGACWPECQQCGRHHPIFFSLGPKITTPLALTYDALFLRLNYREFGRLMATTCELGFTPTITHSPVPGGLTGRMKE